MPANSSTKLQPDFSQWRTKHEAAVILDCSTKTIEKFSQDGKLQMSQWRRPSGGPKIAVFHPGDVEKLRAARAAKHHAFVMQGSAVLDESAVATKVDNRLLQIFTALTEAKSEPAKLLGTTSQSRKPEVAIKDRVYLTVAEASAYAGIPEGQLRRLIQDGKLPSRKEGHTRVKRTDLEKL